MKNRASVQKPEVLLRYANADAGRAHACRIRRRGDKWEAENNYIFSAFPYRRLLASLFMQGVRLMCA